MRIAGLTVVLVVSVALSGCVHCGPAPGPATGSPTDIATRTCHMWQFADFIITGTVVGAASGEPLPYAELCFFDTEEPATEEACAPPRPIGMANRRGEIDVMHGESWCSAVSFESLGVPPPDLTGVPEDEVSDVLMNAYFEALEASPGSRAFVVEVSSRGYEPFRKSFALKGLASEEPATYEIDLGTVALKGAEDVILMKGR